MSLLSEDQGMIRDMARAFAAERLAPGAAERDRSGEPPRDLLAEMGGLGLMGMTVPEQWGGAGTDFLSYVLALEEVAAADGAISTIMSVNNSPVCAALLQYAPDGLKQTWLPPLARGEAIGAFCLTEPQAGSDASALRCRAEADGNGWRISGTKQFITSGSIAGLALVFAVTDPQAGKRGLSCFAVPTDAAGFQVARVESKLGQRCSDTCQIVLDGVSVTADQMLGAPGDGYRIALANLESGRIGIAAQAVGMARAALDAALAYAEEREAFGQAIVEHQAVAFRLADMATEVEVARQMVHHAARLKDAGQPCLKEASMAKLFASEMAERVCSAAIQVHGGYGYLSDYPVERIYRDVRVCQIYEGTSDVQRIVIGRALRG
ncbi:acyl-CoA dehydrogenase family protein [Marinibaculum pumilum]|uniref:Acyl-CoA dehydrogenase family protein n=1 Tax=Marinibaculum pumilum TaxID=1766165 RepID=A0ABV7KZ75_9PROT